MAVVAGVWGFWDIIAGLVLAGWWGRRPAVMPVVAAAKEHGA
jgi:BASS family bile acid:Na+ symporter